MTGHNPSPASRLREYHTRIAVEHARARGESVEAIAEHLDLDPLLVADLWAVQDDIAGVDE